MTRSPKHQGVRGRSCHRRAHHRGEETVWAHGGKLGGATLAGRPRYASRTKACPGGRAICDTRAQSGLPRPPGEILARDPFPGVNQPREYLASRRGGPRLLGNANPSVTIKADTHASGGLSAPSTLFRTTQFRRSPRSSARQGRGLGKQEF